VIYDKNGLAQWILEKLNYYKFNGLVNRGKKVLVKFLNWTKIIIWQDRRILSRCDELKNSGYEN